MSWITSESVAWKQVGQGATQVLNNRRKQGDVCSHSRLDIAADETLVRGRVDPAHGTASETSVASPWTSEILPAWTRRTGWLATPGRRLGPYRLVERLGRGRQADVWRAVKEPERKGMPTTQVALKLLPAADPLSDPRRNAQLRHEAERGTRFADPSLLPTYDFGEVDGLMFLSMPLVVGCTLAEVLDHRRAYFDGHSLGSGSHRLASSPEPHYSRTITALLARVARAVDAAHSAKVVHRDIKPTNILVRYDFDCAAGPADPTGPPAVFLCDFGLARDLDVATSWQLRDGAGSPLYMAPERLLKRPADEVRCDVFALGVTLYEALTLRPPVEVPPELPSTEWANYLAQASPRPAGSFQPNFCPDLENVVHRAMAREPFQRHATAAELAADLERVSRLRAG